MTASLRDTPRRKKAREGTNAPKEPIPPIPLMLSIPLSTTQTVVDAQKNLWITTSRSQDPIFATDSALRAFEKDVRQSIQPLNHCYPQMFPPFAEHFSLQRYLPTADLKRGSRGAMCLDQGVEKKCHRRFLPSFLYTHPTITCTAAKNAGETTLVWHFAVSDATSTVTQIQVSLSDCWRCHTSALDNCSINGVILIGSFPVPTTNPSTPPPRAADSVARSLSPLSSVPDELAQHPGLADPDEGIDEESKSVRGRGITVGDVSTTLGSRSNSTSAAAGHEASGKRPFSLIADTGSLLGPAKISKHSAPAIQSSRQTRVSSAPPILSPHRKARKPSVEPGFGRHYIVMRDRLRDKAAAAANSGTNDQALSDSGGSRNVSAASMPSLSLMPSLLAPVEENSLHPADGGHRPESAKSIGNTSDIAATALDSCAELLQQFKSDIEESYATSIEAAEQQLGSLQRMGNRAQESMRDVLELCMRLREEAAADRRTAVDMQESNARAERSLQMIEKRVADLSTQVVNKDQEIEKGKGMLAFSNDQLAASHKTQEAIEARLAIAINDRTRAEDEALRFQNESKSASARQAQAEDAMDDLAQEADEAREEAEELRQEVDRLRAQLAAITEQPETSTTTLVPAAVDESGRDVGTVYESARVGQGGESDEASQPKEESDRLDGDEVRMDHTQDRSNEGDSHNEQRSHIEDVQEITIKEPDNPGQLNP